MRCTTWPRDGLDISLPRLLGTTRHEVETDVTVSAGDHAQLVETARKRVAEGFRVLKLKVGTDPETDVDRVRGVRDAVGPDIRIRVDANQGWRPRDAIRVIRALEDAGVDLEFVEQPVPAPDLAGLARVTAAVDTPVMADESVFGVRDLSRLIETGAADLVNIKLAKCGGLSPALAMASLAKAHGIGFIVGSMMEGPIGVGAAASLGGRGRVDVRQRPRRRVVDGGQPGCRRAAVRRVDGRPPSADRDSRSRDSPDERDPGGRQRRGVHRMDRPGGAARPGRSSPSLTSRTSPGGSTALDELGPEARSRAPRPYPHPADGRGAGRHHRGGGRLGPRRGSLAAVRARPSWLPGLGTARSPGAERDDAAPAPSPRRATRRPAGDRPGGSRSSGLAIPLGGYDAVRSRLLRLVHHTLPAGRRRRTTRCARPVAGGGAGAARRGAAR